MSTETSDSYNGWANYETWAVKLWLDNDEGFHGIVQVWINDYSSSKGKVADFLKDLVEETNPLAGSATMFTDLLGHAIGRVDWFEIAASVLEDNEEVTV